MYKWYAVAQWWEFGDSRDVVAQWLGALGDTRLSRSSPGFESGYPHSLLIRVRKSGCVCT
jgi:hypothetical protein